MPTKPRTKRYRPRFPSYTYEGFVGGWLDYGGMTSVRVCSTCGRFVKADPTSNENRAEPNATCSKCGRVRMLDV